MRSPGSWAVTVRRPDGGLARVCRPVSSAASRHRVLRLPILRGMVALGESLVDRLPGAGGVGVVRRRRGGRGARPRGRRRADARPDRVRVRDRDRVRRPRLQGLAGGDHRPAADPLDHRVRAGRGRDPGDAARRLPGRDLVHPRPAPRVPVPRRRAQDDQRLRGRRRARARAGADLLQDPPPLRDGVPAVGDGDRDLRLRVRRPARLADADRLADPAPAGHRRPRLRGHPLRRQAPARTRSCARCSRPACGCRG